MRIEDAGEVVVAVSKGPLGGTGGQDETTFPGRSDRFVTGRSTAAGRAPRLASHVFEEA
jgi:hypothetical protein